MGFPPNRLIRWAGSLPWTTRLWPGDRRAHQERGQGASVFLCGARLPPLSSQHGPGSRAHKAIVSACGVECDPIAHRGWAQEGWKQHYRLRSPGHCLCCSLLPAPPMRTCLADPESSPRTKRAHICEYFLIWKHMYFHRHSSRMVTSALGMKAGTVVRTEPSRSVRTPPAQPVHPRYRLQAGAWWWEGGGKEVYIKM